MFTNAAHSLVALSDLDLLFALSALVILAALFICLVVRVLQIVVTWFSSIMQR